MSVINLTTGSPAGVFCLCNPVLVANKSRTAIFPLRSPYMMKALRIVLAAVCCFGIGYGYWGAFTESGNERYEEMAALLPFYIMLGSAALLAIMGLYHIVIFMIKRSNK